MKSNIYQNTYKHKKWTQSAQQCYLIGANCDKCKIVPNDIKNKCRMKATIIGLTETLGRPFDRTNNILNCTPCKLKKNSVK